MRTDKVILRAVLTTLASIVALFGFMLLALCLIFPSTMMELTYDLGMNETSVKYASRAYDRTDDVYYAAFATEISIDLEDAEKIEEYGLQLIADDEFEEYCKARNDLIAEENAKEENENAQISITYEQYIYGQVTLAQYAQGKTADAVETAFEGLDGGFPENNAAAILFLTARRTGDNVTALVVEEKMVEIQSTLDETSADYQYIDALRSLLNG